MFGPSTRPPAGPGPRALLLSAAAPERPGVGTGRAGTRWHCPGPARSRVSVVVSGPCDVLLNGPETAVVVGVGGRGYFSFLLQSVSDDALCAVAAHGQGEDKAGEAEVRGMVDAKMLP
eukprot:766977-Hanusia_phi.AAC.5